MEKFAEKFTFIIVLSIIFFVICSLLVKLIKHDIINKGLTHHYTFKVLL